MPFLKLLTDSTFRQCCHLGSLWPLGLVFAPALLGLYRNLLRSISIACAPLGAEPKEAPLQRLVGSFG